MFSIPSPTLVPVEDGRSRQPQPEAATGTEKVCTAGRYHPRAPGKGESLDQGRRLGRRAQRVPPASSGSRGQLSHVPLIAGLCF